MSTRLLSPRSAVVALAAFCALPVRADFHLVRITPVLDQPTCVVQAQGDPTNILYYTTRISTSTSGFSPAPPNTMGKVWCYDLNTQTSTAVLDLSARRVYNDDGLQCIAFHPDFNNLGSNGYGKMYVSSSEYVGPLSPPNGNIVPIDRVEEYTLNPANPAAGATLSRLILLYTNNTQNNHTVGWIGFDPNAAGVERSYLYIDAADASYGNNYGAALSPNGRPSQNPADIHGKILRVDVSGGDDYPADPNKNFAIPPSNPIPVYNVAHPGTPLMGSNASGAVPALGEVYITGVRNPYRVSFDRATSDIYFGDVGENTNEEVDFMKAGSNANGPPVDFGWPQIEGTNFGAIPGAPSTTVNPFTGVTSLYPLRNWKHGAAGNAAIGGYVYRGPIPELQGKYFYADFVTGTIWMLDFDRNTNPSTFFGTNGTLTDITAYWNSLIVDPVVGTYSGDTNIATINGLDHVVSFGEDNQGNLYIVDFGYGAGFNGQYTASGGEIFEVVPGPLPQPNLAWSNTVSGVKFSWLRNFKLQWQTNAPGVGVTGSWLDYPGGSTSPVTVPTNSFTGSVFFRLLLHQ